MRYKDLPRLSSVLLSRIKISLAELVIIPQFAVFIFALGIVRTQRNLFEHVSATQCVAASADFSSVVHMHESEVQTILSQSLCLRSAPHSCEKCEYLVRQPYDAKRNSCYEPCWCDHFCSYRNRAQRCASHDGCA